VLAALERRECLLDGGELLGAQDVVVMSTGLDI